MEVIALLEQPHLVVVSGEPDFELQHIAQIITHSVTVDGRLGLEQLFGRLLGEVERCAVSRKTLDLIGHARGSGSLLALGDWVIDLANDGTAAFFRGIAEGAVLPRLGVHALRLLGCNTACTAQGRATIAGLADLLGLEVHGSKQLLHTGHYEAAGFRDCWSFLLVAASELRREASESRAVAPADPGPRILDLAALPAIALGSLSSPWPRRFANPQAAREILQLVRRREGARMLGVVTAPMYELALASAEPHAYHIADVLLDGAFLRFYPDGMAATGIAFPVDDAGALRRVVAALPAGCYT